MIKIAPSILSADFSKLGEEIINITKSGADYIHIDVMDGSFVPNITLGNEVVRSIRKTSSLPFDVHLMINKPEKLVDDFIDAGSDIITFHLESTNNAAKLIDHIKKRLFYLKLFYFKVIT